MEDKAELVSLLHYYRQAYACLLANRFDSDEDRKLFTTNVVAQIINDFNEIVGSQSLSHLIERFLPHASFAQLATLIKLFFDDDEYPDRYLTDRTGSQILQACFSELHRFTREIRAQDGCNLPETESVRTIAQLAQLWKSTKEKRSDAAKAKKLRRKDQLTSKSTSDGIGVHLLTDKIEMRDTIYRAIAYLWNSLFEHAEDVYASHLIRVLLELLAGVSVSSRIVRSRASTAFQQRSNTALHREIAEMNEKEDGTSVQASSAKPKQPVLGESSDILHTFYPLDSNPERLVTKLVRRLLKRSKSAAKQQSAAVEPNSTGQEHPFPGAVIQQNNRKRRGPQWDRTAVAGETIFAEWLVSPVANPVLQTVALISRSCAPDAFKQLYDALLLALQRDSSLVNHEVASYAIETFLNGIRDDADLLRKFHKDVLEPRVAEFARGSFSNYVLGAFVRCIAPHDADALRQCFEAAQFAVSNADSALSHALLRSFAEGFASGRSEADSRRFIDHVLSIVKHDCGVTGGDGTVVKSSSESFIIEWLTTPNVHATQRSLLIQCLLRFAAATNRRITDAFLELSADRFVELACHRTASRCVEAFFRTESVKKDAKKRFVERFCDATDSDKRSLRLACDTFGSRCLDTIFSACDVQARWRIAQSLSQNIATLKEDRIGRFQCRNMRLDYLLTAGKTRWMEALSPGAAKNQFNANRSYNRAPRGPADNHRGAWQAT